MEILFRGKRTDNGEWVYGFLWVNRTATRETFYITDAMGEMFQIQPETVGQYTGLDDKNGVKIFKGDIVNGTGWIGDSITGRVIFENGAFYILAYYGELRTLHLLGGLYYDATEVIGNIHDNPELMEVQNEKP